MNSQPKPSYLALDVTYNIRPMSVCWCPWLPEHRLQIETNILILQHPFEERRKVRTARILELALADERVLRVRGRKFNAERCPDLMPILTGDHSYVLFPYRGAIPAHQCCPPLVGQDCPRTRQPRWLVVLDGTWTQARHMLTGSPLLFAMKRVCLPSNPETGAFTQSEFIVRRQPFPAAVCTVEAVARILDLWEPNATTRDKDFYQTQLLRPLRRICEIQTAWKSEQANKQLFCQPIEHSNRPEVEIYPTRE
ncbi:DTW domain-containing protein 2 [Paragonimus heterotremus]|uniref:tRNA-uridine aminocarboxypropyltransferase n=1 Tax=Paragonimus heterotremus TaxID=100268 RepID=A0A8J4SSD2_9TREM|nr:DTW domain-containing protein 2 [Paragonimus heterotremus]